jgi:hypothetical protein
LPGSPSGEAGEGLALDAVLEEEFFLALDFCAQGGRLGSSCVVAIPLPRKTVRARRIERLAWGVGVSIGN